MAEPLGPTPSPANGRPAKVDPAFAIPTPPTPEKLRLEAGVVYRDNPIVVTNTGWTPALIRGAFAQLVAGVFDGTAQLIDSLVGDSRVMAGLDSRVGGLLGRPVDFVIPSRYRDSELAKECLRAFVEAWPTLAAEPVVAQLQTWAILLGHGHAQQLWDTSGQYAIPHPRVWHPRYTYYDWTQRRVMAITQDEGAIPIEGGDGHWIEHAPHGIYRGWMRGAVRAIAMWWLARNYALTDASRWSEANGQPLLRLKYPASADRAIVERFRRTMGNRGSETCADLPQGVPEAGQGSGANANFDCDFIAPPGVGFEGFFKLIDACDREITLALLAQTLTSSVGPEGRGSYAAARVHADVRQALIEADARALARTIYLHIARPFAAMNFGLADLAPIVVWNVEPYEDAATKASTLLTFTQSLTNMRNAGFEISPQDAARLAKAFGLDLGSLKKASAADLTAVRGRDPDRRGPFIEDAVAVRIAATDTQQRVRIALAEMSGRRIDDIDAEQEVIAEIAAMVAEQNRSRRRMRR